MESLHPTGIASFCLCLCVASAVAQAPDPPADRGPGPMPLTTDTVAYCARLAGELDHVAEAPWDVRALTTEGRRMCAEGHVIGGLIRLRHAMMILRDIAARH